MTSNAPRWDVVIVTYNSSPALRELWLGGERLDDAHVIVVDNSSSDDSYVVAQNFADKVIGSPNRGLSRANNIGAQAGDSEFLLFCNPDVKIEREILESLADILKERGGIVAPRLIGLDGEVQPNARAYPTIGRQLESRFRRGAAGHPDYMWPDTENAEYWVTGACVAMTRYDYERLGGWPEEFFLYFEDVEICARARQLGMNVSLAESVKVLHLWRRESGRLWSKAGRMHVRSAFQYYAAAGRRRRTGKGAI